MIDLHSHVLPGLDDGPRDVAGSLEILDAAAADGIATIAATPHVTDEYPTTADAMEAALVEVQALGHAVRVLPGAELDIRSAAELDDTTLVSTRFLSITCAFASRSSSCEMRCSSIICSFFASSYSAFSAISPNSRAAAMRSATSRRLVVRSTSSSLVSCL